MRTVLPAALIVLLFPHFSYACLRMKPRDPGIPLPCKNCRAGDITTSGAGIAGGEIDKNGECYARTYTCTCEATEEATIVINGGIGVSSPALFKCNQDGLWISALSPVKGAVTKLKCECG